jgi:predicted ATP-binding protein involved in virulence
MEPNTTLRLDRMELKNFRCFADCVLDLDPILTVLVADNAQGKTALLNGISIALEVFVASAIPGKHSHGFDRTDIHRLRVGEKEMVPAPMVTFVAEGIVDGETLQWGRSLSSHTLLARSSTKDMKKMRAAAERLVAGLSNADANEPVTDLRCSH